MGVVFAVVGCASLESCKTKADMMPLRFSLSFGGDEFDVVKFRVPRSIILVEYANNFQTYYRGMSNEYTLYKFTIISGEVTYANGQSIGEYVYIPLAASPDVENPNNKGVSAAMIDKISNEVIPIGRGVLSSID